MSPWHTRRFSPSGTSPRRPKSTWSSVARRRVVDPDRDRAPPGPAALDGEAGQGAVRDDDAPAVEQDPDLDDGEVLASPTP